MAESGKAVWALVEKIRGKKINIDQFIAEFEEILANESTDKFQTPQFTNGESKNTIFHELVSLDEAYKAVAGLLKHFQSDAEDEEDKIVAILKQENKDGDTVLRLAFKQKQTSVVKLLLENIAEDKTKLELINQDFGDMENGPQTILHLAEQQKCHDLVEWVVKTTSIVQSIQNETRNALYEVLQISVESGKVQRFKALLNLIPLGNRLDFLRRQSENYESSVVHIAFEKGNADVLTVIKDSLNLDKQKHLVHLLKEENGQADNPLQLAIVNGHYSMIPLLKELLESPEDICDVLRAGTVPALYFSALEDNNWFKKVFALVPKSERKNMLRQSIRGRQNVVHLIFRYGMIGNLEVIETDFGNDTDFLDNILMSTDAGGSTPLHLAAQENLYGIIRHVIRRPRKSNEKLLELFVKANVKNQSVVSIALDQCTNNETLGEILRPLASHMEQVKMRYEDSKEKHKTAKEKYTMAEMQYNEEEKKVQNRVLTEKKTVEKDREALREYQKIRDRRNDDLTEAKKELDRIERTRKVITKNLEFVKLVVHKRDQRLSSIATGLLKLMHSPVECLGLLILHAESDNADFITNHQELVCEALKKSFLNPEKVNQAWKYLEMRAEQDISEEEIKECRQELLGLATSNMADQKADQFVLRWTDSSGNTLAHIAAMAGDIESIKRLVEWQITSHPENKDSVLHFKNNDDKTPGTVSPITQKASGWELKLLKKLDKYPAPLQTDPEFHIFYQSKKREGAEEEVEELKRFGRAFVAEPAVHPDATREEIRRVIKPESEKKESASCLIVAILAHGRSGQVKMSDGWMVIKEIIKQMESRQGSKPMVLLLQACQIELPEKTDSERQADDVSQEDMPEGETMRNLLNGTRRQQQSTLVEKLSRHQVPHNITLDTVPPLETIRSDNLVLRSTFAVGKMVSGLDNDSITEVQDLKDHGNDAISMLSQAFCFLKGRSVRTLMTTEGYPEEYDLSIASGYAFDHVPPHFLCLSATVNAGSATRGVMTRWLCKKLNEMIDHQKSLPGPVEIDIQRLFEHVLAAVHVESRNDQVSIIARTLLKRLCLTVKRPEPQANDNGNDDEDKKGDEASNKGDNSQQPVS